MRWLALVLLVPMFSGCMGLFSCVSSDDAAELQNSLNEGLANLDAYLGSTWTVSMQEPDSNTDFVMAVDENRKLVHMSGDVDGEYLDLTVIDSDVTYLDDIDEYWLRDERGLYEDFASELGIGRDLFSSPEDAFLQEDVSFDEGTFECTQRGGRDVIAYEETDPETGDYGYIVLDATTHKLYEVEIRDAFDNIRMQIAYAVTNVQLDRTLTKLPASFDFDIVAAEGNNRGGYYGEIRVTDESEWRKLSEIEIHLIDDADQNWGSFLLSDLDFDWGDGDVGEYDDRDHNGLVSTGDRIYVDFGANLDYYLYDAWADDWAEEFYN